MYNLFYSLFLSLISSLLTLFMGEQNTQHQLDILSPNDKIEIYRTSTGNSISRQNDLCNIDKINSNFGQADSSRTRDIEALGGLVEFLYYDNNYFIIPRNKFANDGFEINDSNFFVTINNSFKIQIGDKINPLLKRINPKRNYTKTKVIGTPLKSNISNIGRVSLPYGYLDNEILKVSEHWLVVYYDMNSMKIIRIFDYHAS